MCAVDAAVADVLLLDVSGIPAVTITVAAVPSYFQRFLRPCCCFWPCCCWCSCCCEFPAAVGVFVDAGVPAVANFPAVGGRIFQHLLFIFVKSPRLPATPAAELAPRWGPLPAPLVPRPPWPPLYCPSHLLFAGLWVGHQLLYSSALWATGQIAIAVWLLSRCH